jgi:hypothetical protein
MSIKILTRSAGGAALSVLTGLPLAFLLAQAGTGLRCGFCGAASLGIATLLFSPTTGGAGMLAVFSLSWVLHCLWLGPTGLSADRPSRRYTWITLIVAAAWF